MLGPDPRVGDQVDENGNKSPTYEMWGMCINCGIVSKLDIPRGVRVNEYRYECSNCGVRDQWARSIAQTNPFRM